MVNISTGGCALDQLSLHLALKEKVLISIALPGSDIVFQAQGIVVRIENDLVAVQFSLVEQEDVNHMRMCFSRLARY